MEKLEITVSIWTQAQTRRKSKDGFYVFLTRELSFLLRYLIVLHTYKIAEPQLQVSQITGNPIY